MEHGYETGNEKESVVPFSCAEGSLQYHYSSVRSVELWVSHRLEMEFKGLWLLYFQVRMFHFTTGHGGNRE